MKMFADRLEVPVKVRSPLGFSKRLVCRCTLSQGCPKHRIAQGRPRSANDPGNSMWTDGGHHGSAVTLASPNPV